MGNGFPPRHPVREEIVSILEVNGVPLNLAELAERFPDAPISNVSYHIVVMRKEGFLRVARVDHAQGRAVAFNEVRQAPK